MLPFGNHPVGEWAIYLGEIVRDRMKGDGVPISYCTATGYISAFKCIMTDKYCTTGVTQKCDKDVWSRMLSKNRCKNYEYSRICCKRLFGLKFAATSEDKKRLLTIAYVMVA